MYGLRNVCSEVSSGHCGRIEDAATLTASSDRAPFHDAQTYNELAPAIRSGRIPPLPKGYSSALSSVIKSMLNINVSHILPHQSTLSAPVNVSLDTACHAAIDSAAAENRTIDVC